MTAALIAMALIGGPYPANMTAHEGYVPCDRQCRTERRWRRVVKPYRATLRRIARCESGNNPRAVSSTGTYRGLLQFDYQTWGSVGGSGDPAAASRLEQMYRGALLYKRRGPVPWPICGYQ